MTPEEEQEVERLTNKFQEARNAGLAEGKDWLKEISPLEKARLRYLNDKQYAQSAGHINAENVLTSKYNSEIAPFIEESTKRLQEIRNNPNLSLPEKNRLTALEEARYIEQVTPYDRALEQAKRENQLRDRKSVV